MIWILLVVFFTRDGHPGTQAKIEPTFEACVADMAKIREAAIGSPLPDWLAAVSDKCIGPLEDPTVEKKTGQ